MQCRLVAQNEDFIVALKPPGISVHSEEGVAGFCVQLEAHCQQSLFMVHRLDKMTSGLMLFAKRASVAAQLGQQFAERRVDKFYLAMSDRKPRKKQGSIKGDMQRARRGCWRLSEGRDNPAVTRFFSAACHGRRLFILKPETGKTHQLRVALKSVGAPILGDDRYQGAVADRGYLHAWQLHFELGAQRFSYIADPLWGEYFSGDAFLAQLECWRDVYALPWPGR
ncbi:MAG: TIGR01621 family pseudouridine synthase [Pseudomonadales bacterium]